MENHLNAVLADNKKLENELGELRAFCLRNVMKQMEQIENFHHMLEKNNELINKLMDEYADYHSERRTADELRAGIAQSLFDLNRAIQAWGLPAQP
jgi:predicted translin family RNA/ssDNA-binding protein